MAKRKLLNKLIDKSKIKEELKAIEESGQDFITKSGSIYCDYGNNKFLKKKVFTNKVNGYSYVSIKSKSGKQVQRRVHILVAKAFIKKPDSNYNIVMHKDNNKTNNNINNLKWGTLSMNTQQAYGDGLIKNDSGFNDSQSFPIVQIDFITKSVLNIFGSVSIASVKTGVTKSGILYQAKHKTRNINKKPRCGCYFRFYNEYLNKGFVL
jgi:hypothetical protein